MTIDNFTGDDTILLENRLLNDLADGNCIQATFPNSTVNITEGKDGNVIISKIEAKRIDVTIRCLAGGETDEFLTNKYYQYINDSAGYIGFSCCFKKKIGNGKGEKRTIEVGGEVGVVDKLPDMVDNTTGDVSNGVAEYLLHFSRGYRKKQ